MVNVAVIGLGYWGPNLVRNLGELPEVNLKTVCDLSSERLDKIQKRYPWVRVTQKSEDVFNDPAIDAVALATPVFTHFALAERALLAGKHVLVEKPLASTSEQARRLVTLAREKNRVLMVDHVFLYTPAVRKIKEVIESGELGDILYFDSVRVNLGLFQSDINVVWDLAPHDLSIMDYVLPVQPESVQAMGARHAHADFENIAYIHFNFPNDLVAHFHVNWMAPVKIRQILIGGTKKMVVYNNIEPTEKIRIYDKGVNVRRDMDDKGRFQHLISYRAGDVLLPQLENIEALGRACRDFVSHVQSGRKEFEADGVHGARVVDYLQAIDHSLKDGGITVRLSAP